ncbi:MAG: ATP-dependent 6-phosphofructokinase [Candidatus Omnitrophota bacterium]|nr:ATP-dependent 6-phosphofructokinase [Candidatus Omnitrophota bacterium]
MKIGILTGGGDCPGLNPVIRAIVRKGLLRGYEITGIRDGWKGLIDNDTIRLDIDSVSGIINYGGTILGTSRTNPYKKEGDAKKAIDNYNQLGLSALIAIGGDDTTGAALKLSKQGLNIIGVPKTIDNDLSATDYTFGFDTAVNIAMEAMDRLRTTAESHHRVMVVEIMGRHAGWIAAEAGIAAGADIILIPEIPIDINEVCGFIEKRRGRGKLFNIVAVAEGAKLSRQSEITQKKDTDAFGNVMLGGIGKALAEIIAENTGYETRSVVLGHLQRGGSPTAFDRILGTRFGVKAVELVTDKKFGQMVSIQGNKITSVPLEEAVGKLKTLDMELYEIGKIFSG